MSTKSEAADYRECIDLAVAAETRSMLAAQRARSSRTQDLREMWQDSHDAWLTMSEFWREEARKLERGIA